MWILLLLPYALLALSQLLALVAFAQVAPSQQAGVTALGVPLLVYLAAALLSTGAVSLAAIPARGAGTDPRGSLIALAALAGVLICAAPLLWGRAIGEFHASHHLVRGLLVAGSLVLYSWYVASHR
ncbi:hypothetical protein [Brachybacterium phenoliresistens]|nr:hypothetical protein [Brachybacterium phenoliresistens]